MANTIFDLHEQIMNKTKFYMQVQCVVCNPSVSSGHGNLNQLRLTNIAASLSLLMRVS